MRNWYADVTAKPQRERQFDWIALAQWLHDFISAAVGGFILLLLAFVLTGARLW